MSKLTSESHKLFTSLTTGPMFELLMADAQKAGVSLDFMDFLPVVLDKHLADAIRRLAEVLREVYGEKVAAKAEGLEMLAGALSCGPKFADMDCFSATKTFKVTIDQRAKKS